MTLLDFNGGVVSLWFRYGGFLCGWCEDTSFLVSPLQSTNAKPVRMIWVESWLPPLSLIPFCGEVMFCSHWHGNQPLWYHTKSLVCFRLLPRGITLGRVLKECRTWWKSIIGFKQSSMSIKYPKVVWKRNPIWGVYCKIHLEMLGSFSTRTGRRVWKEQDKGGSPWASL